MVTLPGPGDDRGVRVGDVLGLQPRQAWNRCSCAARISGLRWSRSPVSTAPGSAAGTRK